MTDLVGVRECARRLTAKGMPINPSTLSRQLQKGIITNRGTEDAPLIDMATVEAERAAGLDQSKQRGAAAPLFASRIPPEGARQGDTQPGNPVEPGAEADEPSDAGSAAAAKARLKYTDARTYREGYAAKLAELEYREKVGELVGQAGAEQGYQDGAHILRDRLLALPAQLAGTLAAMTDEAEIAAFLRERIQRALAEVADETDDVDGFENDADDDDAVEPARPGADRLAEPEGLHAR